ncbi:MAG TPA: hypothetical protein PKK00_04345 [Bacteroidales bacterium]|nr:hypothetical protein [Bacteroidales bacterium]HPS16589.1 hypothetical protein [Bacteroidales bacterium]
MPRKRYSLINGGPKEIEISWGFAWKNFTVRHNGQIIGTVGSQRELKEGRQFNLLDGTTLWVKLNVGFGKAGLEVLHNGQPCPGSDSDPAQKIKVAFGILLFVALFNTVIGLLLETIGGNEFKEIGIGVVFYGLIFIGLAFLVKKLSLIALITAIVLLIADAVTGLVFQMMSNNNMSFAWIVVRVLFLIYLFQSVKPLKELKQAANQQ